MHENYCQLLGFPVHPRPTEYLSPSNSHQQKRLEVPLASQSGLARLINSNSLTESSRFVSVKFLSSLGGTLAISETVGRCRRPRCPLLLSVQTPILTPGTPSGMSGKAGSSPSRSGHRGDCMSWHFREARKTINIPMCTFSLY